MIYKNEYIRVFAKIGDWYVIQTNGDYIGMVSSKYVKLIYQKAIIQIIKIPIIQQTIQQQIMEAV